MSLKKMMCTQISPQHEPSKWELQPTLNKDELSKWDLQPNCPQHELSK
jgi:hypothetical protein